MRSEEGMSHYCESRDFCDEARDRLAEAEKEIEQLREAAQVLLRQSARQDEQINRLFARLAMIADIAEGSGTTNSLPHIARIARGGDKRT
jgi:hypothetical protein